MSDYPEEKDQVSAEGQERTEWWDASLTRREANKVGASMTMLLGLSGLSLGLEGCCGGSDDDSIKATAEKIEESDSISAQKKHGWDKEDALTCWNGTHKKQLSCWELKSRLLRY